jgi:hypothetical protein
MEEKTGNFIYDVELELSYIDLLTWVRGESERGITQRCKSFSINLFISVAPHSQWKLLIFVSWDGHSTLCQLFGLNNYRSNISSQAYSSNHIADSQARWAYREAKGPIGSSGADPSYLKAGKATRAASLSHAGSARAYHRPTWAPADSDLDAEFSGRLFSND